MTEETGHGTETAPGQNKTYTIVINARQHTIDTHKISYERVLELAGVATGNQATMFTVIYEHGEHGKDGAIVPGDIVVIKDGMVFNVTTTNKS